MATVAPGGVAIVAMPLAAVDRRSLSQAWFDALHLAKSAQPAKAGGTARIASLQRPSAHVGGRAANTPAGSALATMRAHHVATASRAVPHGAVLDRRAPRSLLARRIAERIATQPVANAQRLTLTAGDGRVQIIIRGTRIVAVCAPSLREAVSRALVEARYHLAARGVRLETAVRERAAC